MHFCVTQLFTSLFFKYHQKQDADATNILQKTANTFNNRTQSSLSLSELEMTPAETRQKGGVVLSEKEILEPQDRVTLLGGLILPRIRNKGVLPNPHSFFARIRMEEFC